MALSESARTWTFGGVLALVLGACSVEENPPNEQPTGGAAGTSAGSGSAGKSSGGSSGSGPVAGSAGSGGSSGSAGGTASGGKGGTGATGSAGTAGASASGGAAGSSGGVGGSPSAGAGGTPAGGSGGGSAGGGSANGGSGGSAPTGCTRELLRNAVDAYFEALAARDPSTLPLASNVKFTEDGEELELGEAGLWTTAGEVEYSHSALDVEKCQSATQAVVPDGSSNIPFALRLKLENQQITEIETIAVQTGDYTVGGSNFPSNTQAMIDSEDDVHWEQSVPETERATYEELTSWMDKYYRVFPSGVCNTAPSCTRLENGGGSFMCSAGASCTPGQPTGSPELEPRLILADVETGLGVGFTMFQGHTDMHMFKMHGEMVFAVHAILAAADDSGWD